jgi:hypothetical protein
MHQREPNGMKAPNCAPNWPIVLMLITEKVWQNQLADDAVQCELVSGKNSLISGKNTGNLLRKGKRGTLWSQFDA